jgi:hypothetical protein
MMDPRVVSEAQMKNRIDAFFEGLESRQRVRARGARADAAAAAAADAAANNDAAPAVEAAP